MIRVLVFAFFVPVAVPVASTAQTAPEHQPLSKSELVVGYSYLFRDYRHTQLSPMNGGMKGWNAEYARPNALRRHWGFTVDCAGYYTLGGFFTPQIYFTTIGPRYTISARRSTVEFRALAGGILSSGDVIAQTASHVRPIFGTGGGWEYSVEHRLGWQVGFDWIYGGFKSNDTNQITQIVQNNGRVSVGPVWRF